MAIATVTSSVDKVARIREALDFIDYTYAKKLQELVNSGVDGEVAKYRLSSWYRSEYGKVMGRVDKPAKSRAEIEYEARQERIKAKEDRRKVRQDRPVFAGNNCRVCGELIPHTGKRGRPATVCVECKS